jgi:tRNA A58 N-methylase Trm61
MLPKDIGLVIAGTGMNRKDHVLDAGTGTGSSMRHLPSLSSFTD